jgi:hypothetical protein
MSMKIAVLLGHGIQRKRQRQRKPKKAMEGKRYAQNDLKEIIPFDQDQEKDEEALRHF